MPSSVGLHLQDLCAKTPSWWYLSDKNDRLVARSEEREVRGHIRKEKEV